MREWATSGRVKIDRANEHIRHVETEFAAFTKRRPYVIGPEFYDEDYDPTDKRYGHVFPIIEREQVDIRWSAVVADAVHNLHAALDHLWQRVTTSEPHRQNYFPARKSPEAAKSVLGRKEKGRRPPAIELLASVNAFEVGNPFWRIREFDDADKHDTLPLVAVYPGDLRVNFARMRGRYMPDEIIWSYLPKEIEVEQHSSLSVLENGAALYAYPFVADLDVDVELAPLIVFGEGGPLKGEAVLPTLEHFSTAVDSLAAAFIAAGLLK